MKKLFLIFVLLLVACDSSQNNKTRDPLIESDPFKNLMSQPSYYKDVNTNLCFLGYNVGYKSGIFTNVPCTPEVEKVAIMFKSR